MTKKKILTLALCVAMAAILAVGTLAYFTDDDSAENVFTVGNVDIVLEEPNWEGEGSDDAPEVYPGEALAKDPQVENIGANPCFVRVKVEGLKPFETGDPITLRYQYVDGYNTEDWELLDGYYYYKKVVAAPANAGDEYNEGLTALTTPVFDQIVIPSSWTNGDAETEYSVDVFAEAVQAQGARASYSAVKNMTVAEIAAWFETCGL